MPLNVEREEKMNRIKEYRDLIGLTQAELADKANCSVRAIGYYESGTKTPNANVIIRIAKALKKTVEQLYSTDEEK